MKNYTKALAEQIVAVMDRYNNYEELEKIVICYGMELFLNSILKISIYFVIGFSIGKGVETILSIIIFGSLRKVSGGRHAKTDVGCFIMTGSIIFLAVMSPDVVNVIVGILQLDILPISIRQHFLAIIPQHKEIYQCIAVFSAIH